MAPLKKTPAKSAKDNNLFAIAESSGKQFWFEVGRYYDVDKLNVKEKDKITLDKVLLVKENENISLGRPYIKDAAE